MKTAESNPVAVANLRDAMRGVRVHVLAPPPNISLPQWADKYRRLSTSSGAIGGAWKTSRVEVARGPMMAVTEKGVRTLTVQSCTQLLKTSLLENTLGFFAHLDPCPMLLTQAKEGAVTSFSKERLKPMARATPVLRNLFGETKQHRGEDTLQFKEFPGGFLAMESAGSPTNLAMRAIRITLLDEIDKYETNKEGDPVMLAEERTSTFKYNSLHIRTCSPTWEETSRIHKSYLESDQRKPFVNCPHCGESQTLDFFRHVHWEKSEEGEHYPLTARIVCTACEKDWTEADRMMMMTTEGSIRWKQTRAFKCCGIQQEPVKTRNWKWDEKNQVDRACCVECGTLAVSNAHAGFKASKLYSPFITVPELAQKWIAAKDDPESKQTFYNTQLGEAFQVQAMRRIESHGLTSRRETYRAEVPIGVCVLTAGIDVQSGGAANDARLEVEVKGWGLGEENWNIAFEIFEGDPAKPEVWAKLDAFLQKPFKYEGGGVMGIRAACIDSGGHSTQEVYNYAKVRTARNIWAIKGASDKGGQWSPVWPPPSKKVSTKYKTGFKPTIIGTNSAKEAIRQRLLIDEPGPGYCHFPMDRTEGYFEQLTSEQLVIEKKAGSSIRKWILQKGRRNEALDCTVYAYAALCGLYIVRKLNMEKIAAMLETFKPTDAPAPDEDIFEDEAETPAAPAPAAKAAKPVRNRVRRSKFLS